MAIWSERMLVAELSTLDPLDDGDGHVEMRETLATAYTTELARAAAASGVDGEASAATVLSRAGVRDGQPFVLGPDGSYDLELNRFFRELSIWGVRAENSIAA